MSLTYTGDTGLFTFLGRIFKLTEQVNTCRGSDVAGRVDTAIDQLKEDTSTNLLIESALSQAPSSLQSWQGSADSFLAQWQAAAATYLRGVVLRDATQPADTIDNALAYLIAQMAADDVYVDPNVVGLSLAAGSGNSSNDFAIFYTSKGGNGKNLENMLAEAIAIDLPSVNGIPSVRTLGKESRGLLSHEWPLGSGHTAQFSAVDPAASLLTNGDFGDATVTNVPDDWHMLDGVPGTAYLLTDWEVQQVVIASSPTAGGYYLRFTSPTGPVYVTSRLAFDAGQSAVQAALRALPGLSLVTVSTSGTTPNYTHTITFVGVAGDLTTLAAESQLDTGTITPSQVTAGDANAYRGRSLKVVGSGAANRRFYHILPTLTADTVYFIGLRHKKTGTPAAGSVTVKIVPGYGGSVIADSAGNNNSTSFDLTSGDVTTSYTAAGLSIRIPPSVAQPVYLEINVASLSAGTTYCLDEVVLVEGTELYPGGPIATAVAGKSGPIASDVWTLTATNDRAGKLQEWFARVFDMRSRRLLLPSAGSTNIPDSLVA